MYSAVKIRRRKIKDDFLIISVLTSKYLIGRMLQDINYSCKRLQRCAQDIGQHLRLLKIDSW